MKINTIKTIGDWELDVLGVPYGGPEGGKDLEGEYFSPSTNLHLEQFGNPMVLYYHGAEPDGKPQGEPKIIGKAISYEERSDGVWWRVALDKTSAYAKRVMDAARQGIARASSGSIAHLTRKVGGHILNWPVVELSLFDIGDNRQPANSYAVALPVVKAIYAQVGRDFPTLPAAETISDDEKKALQEQARYMLFRDAVDDALVKMAFDREPNETEQLYEVAAIGILSHFQNGKKVNSCPVRIAEYMPDSKHKKDGNHLVGRFTNTSGPQILLKAGLPPKDQYLVFLHEVGHFLDEAIRGEDEYYKTSYCIKSTAREDQADEYRDLLGWFAFDQARRQFYGGKLVKSIPINKLLEALK